MGTLILVSNEFSINNGSESWYSILVIIAAICYAINVNIIKYKLKGISSLGIALGNFSNCLTCYLVLFFSNFPWEKLYIHQKLVPHWDIFSFSFVWNCISKSYV